MACDRLVLGTALLGADYGIAHIAKKTSASDFEIIMETARSAGVFSIDTAVAYGDSHAILGQIGVEDWSVSTKLPALPESMVSLEGWYRNIISSSMHDLKIQQIDTLLIHDVQDLVAEYGPKLIFLLRESQVKGDVKNIGVSIYQPEDLDSFYDAFRPDIVQCPYSIFDQRMRTSGWLQRLNDDGVDVHARSVFLQGIILRNRSELHSYFRRWDSLFMNVESFCKARGVSKLETAIGFVKQESRIHKIIVGIESEEQLKQIVSAFDRSVEGFHDPCNDIELLNPLFWEIL